jgi:hypothetical protein
MIGLEELVVVNLGLQWEHENDDKAQAQWIRAAAKDVQQRNYARCFGPWRSITRKVRAVGYIE